MAERRRCNARNTRGEPCGAWALHDDPNCFRHSPEHAEAAAEASRLAGLRRRKEAAVAQVYDFEGLDSLEGERRLLHIVAVDLLALDNSVPRARALTNVASEARKTLETFELAERIVALERAMRLRPVPRKERRSW